MGGMGNQGAGAQGNSSLGPSQQTTTQALQQQQNFINSLQQQGGLNNQANVFGQQQALSNQLGQIGAGQGVNPALSQLQQSTGQNIAGQTALAANQRGGSANIGSMQRQAAQQGAALQQTGFGQGATLQAQQQLAALAQQQALQQNMQQVAGSQIGAQGAAISGYANNALNQQQIQQQAATAANSQAIQQQQTNDQLLGSISGGVGSIAAMFAGGGQVPNWSTDSTPSGYADGGGVSDQEVARAQLLNGMSGTQNPNNYKGQNYSNTQYTPEQIAAQQASPYYVPPTNQQNANQPKSAAGRIISGMAHGGQVRRMASGGETKTVRARLSPGEIVIPKKIAQHPNAPEMTRNFVRAVHAKKGILKR